MPSAPKRAFHHLKQLSGQVDGWVRSRLWMQVIIGLLLGVAVGAAVGPDFGLVEPETAELIGVWLAVPGRIFLALISMVLIPLVFVSIIKGLTGTADVDRLRDIGLKFVSYVLLTTVAASILGIAVAYQVEPGNYVEMPSSGEAVSVEAPSGEGAAEAPLPIEPESDEGMLARIPDLIVELIPSNPSEAFAEQNMLAIVVFAMFIGLACVSLPAERIETFQSFMDGLLEIAMRVIKWAMFLTPLAVFGLMAELVAKVGLSTIAGLGAYVGTVLLGLLLLLVIYLVIVAVLGRRNPLTFLKSIGNVQLLAFSTSSSAAVMPLSLETAVDKLGVDENDANLIIPLGATINMAGTALYQSVAVVFLAQMSATTFTVADITIIVATLVLSSIGAPGAPGVTIVILANLASQFGLPSAGLVLILGVDRLLDMARTTVNVTGDLTACAVIGRTEND